MPELILAVNPGTTITQIGIFENQVEVDRFNITYDEHDFAGMDCVFDQLDRRVRDLHEALAARHLSDRFDAVIGRGGMVGPVQAGAYFVDDDLVSVLENHPVLEHVSSLGGPIACSIAAEFGVPGCPAFIYDPVTVDSMAPAARITGVKGLERRSIAHHLNMRAVAIRHAQAMDRCYDELGLVVVHLGGGASASAHRYGTIVDVVSDDEIMFSAQRSGGVPIKEITNLLKTMTPLEMNRLVRKRGGLISLLCTDALREVGRRVAEGDQWADLVLDALALQVGKCMASLAVSLGGHIDALIVTGGMAHDKDLCERIRHCVAWLAPLSVYPGERELEALAAGAHRVLVGEEVAHRLSDPV